MGSAKLKDEMEDGQVFADELAPGSELMHGQYRIESFLNAGGFGITYSARDSLDRRVVIKECFPGAFCRRSRALVQARSRAHQNELASIVRLFVQEARSLAKLNHPNIVGVHQVFEENNTAYMALDYIEGRDLLDIIDDPDAHLSPAETENVLRKVLDAVGFIHDQGILHRDISPDNILIDSHGEPVLIDFGAAREQATKQSRVLSALRVVKDGYSPQEFYITGSEQGPYSDLYALGASFYHLIADDVPPNSQARLSAVATGEGDPYRALKGQFPDYKDTLLGSVDQALEILPKDRIESAAHWKAMIDGKALPVAAPVAAFEAKSDPTPKAQAAPVAAEQPKSKKGFLLATVALVALAGVAYVATQTDLLSGAAVDAPAAETTLGAVAPAATSATDEAGGTDVIADPVAEEATLSAATATETPAAAAEVAANDASFETSIAESAPKGQPVPKSPSTPLPTPSAEELVIGSADTPITETETWTRSIPVVEPSAQLVLPQDVAPVETTDQTERRSVIANLPTPAADAAAPALTDPAQAVDEAEVAVDQDPVDFFRSLVGQPETPQNDVLASFDATVPPAPAAEPEGQTAAKNTIPGVSHDWAVLLPLRGMFDLGAGSTRIFAVNGVDVDSLASFNEVVGRNGNLEDASTVALNVLMGTDRATATEQAWTLPVAQTVSLANGWMFETTVEESGWVTRVTDVPVGISGDIRPGDIVFGFIPTSTRLDQRTSLLDILAQEAVAGNSLYNFAIKRGELAFAATIQFDAARFVN